MIRKPPPFKNSLSYLNKTMAFYYQQINNQQQLLNGIKVVLPKTLADQARHCVIKENKLLIYTESATWASQLRFYEEIILSAINNLSRTRILTMQTKIINTLAINRVSNIRKPKLPSYEKIKSLQVDSMAIEDAELRNSLQRLSVTLERLFNTN